MDNGGSATAGAVVAGVDGSAESVRAAQYAAAVAVRRGRPLALVHGYPQPYQFGVLGLTAYTPAVPDPLPDSQVMLDEVAGELRKAHPGLDVRASQIVGGAAAVLVAESRHADMVIVGSRGLGGFAGLLLGSVGAQVAAHAHAPVIVVRQPARPPAPDAPIVVGVDGSPESAAALTLAAAEAASRGAPLHAIHVWWADPLDNLRHPGRDPEPDAERAARQVLADAVTAATGSAPGLSTEARLVHGLNPAQVLIDASQDASLVVVGSRGRGGFAGLILGSVSQALLHHAACPVAVAHRG
jgi:nucleotide-binding universal stress UspA family protein